MSQPEKRSQSFGMIKVPDSLRVAQIALGIITLVLAGIVLAFPTFAIFLVAIWLSISLLFGGIEGVLVGVGAKHFSKGGRAVSIALGAIAIGLSVAVFAFPAATALTLVLLLSVALLFIGASAIARGTSERRMPSWARGMLVAVGVITVGISIPVMIFPAFGIYLLFALVATSLIINGASYIVAGITGAIFRPIGLELGRSSRRHWESGAT